GQIANRMVIRSRSDNHPVKRVGDPIAIGWSSGLFRWGQNTPEKADLVNQSVIRSRSDNRLVYQVGHPITIGWVSETLEWRPPTLPSASIVFGADFVSG